MKSTQLLRTFLFSLLLITGSTFAQPTTTPIGFDTIQCDLNHSGPGENLYEIIQLTSVPADAEYAHLWWSGDNEFSFVPEPIHSYARGGTVFMTDVVTENYGNGGPPPLTYEHTTNAGNTSPKIVLRPGAYVYMQNYRNAVIGDTMYLIVTYGNPHMQDLKGKLVFDVGSYAKIIDSMFYPTSHPQFLPNGEQMLGNGRELKFAGLAPGDERSILIPVRILQTEEDQLPMRVDVYREEQVEHPNQFGVDYYSISPSVAESHDPNLMLESSDAKNQCDYRSGNIHYTVKFQNVGDGATKYVRVETFLDDKVDLNSVTAAGIIFPDFYGGSFQKGTIIGRHQLGAGAIYAIDTIDRKIIFEMHDLPLAGTADPTVVDLERTRDQIEFDIKVKSNYVFGPATSAYSMVFFDEHDPIETNAVETICGDPLPIENGGGFQEPRQTFWDKWKWFIIGGLAIVVGLIGFRIFRKK